MVHIFRKFNRNFVLDRESGSFFMVSDEAKGCIESRIGKNGELANFSQDTQACSEASSEVVSLIRESILFSAGPPKKTTDFNGIIKSMCLNISHRCNLVCGYCFADGGSYNTAQSDMDIGTAKKAIDFLVSKSGSVKHLEVDFFGGEPLLNFPVIKGTIDYARKLEKEKNKRFRFTLTTNALSLTEELDEFLIENMDTVVLSIDGRESVHNGVRKAKDGSQSFNTILSNAKRFYKKRGLKPCFVRGTFTKKNLDFSEDVLFLYSQGFRHISIEPVLLPGNHPLAITKDDLPKIAQEYEKLAKMYLQYRAEGKWFSFFHFNLNLDEIPCEQKLLSGCGAGCSYIAVSADGKIYPCHQFISLPVYEMGDVTKALAKERAVKNGGKALFEEGVYNKQLALELFNKNNTENKPDCEACFSKYFCGGGCMASSAKYTKCLTTPHKLSCEIIKNRIECALAIYALEADS